MTLVPRKRGQIDRCRQAVDDELESRGEVLLLPGIVAATGVVVLAGVVVDAGVVAHRAGVVAHPRVVVVVVLVVRAGPECEARKRTHIESIGHRLLQNVGTRAAS
jgi:hypothetical protein